MKWQTNDIFSGRHCLLNCTQVICTIISHVQQYGWCRPILWMGPEMKHWRLTKRRPVFLLQNLHIASKHPYVYPCVFVASNRYRQSNVLLASINASPSVSLQTAMVLSWRWGSGSLASARVTLLPHFNKIVERELLIMGPQHRVLG